MQFSFSFFTSYMHLPLKHSRLLSIFSHSYRQGSYPHTPTSIPNNLITSLSSFEIRTDDVTQPT